MLGKGEEAASASKGLALDALAGVVATPEFPTAAGVLEEADAGLRFLCGRAGLQRPSGVGLLLFQLVLIVGQPLASRMFSAAVSALLVASLGARKRLLTELRHRVCILGGRGYVPKLMGAQTHCNSAYFRPGRDSKEQMCIFLGISISF